MSGIEKGNFSEYDLTPEEWRERLEAKAGRILWEDPERLVKEMTDEELAKGPEERTGNSSAQEVERHCVLRYATEKDFDGIKAANMDRWRFRAKEYNCEKYKKEQFTEENEANLREQLSEDSVSERDFKSSCLVLTVNGEVAGYVEFGPGLKKLEKFEKFVDDTTAQIYTISVLEKFQKNGFGVILLEDAILEAEKELHAEKVILGTQEENEGGMALYTGKKQGFGFEQADRQFDEKRSGLDEQGNEVKNEGKWMKWNLKTKAWEDRKCYWLCLSLDIKKWKEKQAEKN